MLAITPASWRRAPSAVLNKWPPFMSLQPPVGWACHQGSALRCWGRPTPLRLPPDYWRCSRQKTPSEIRSSRLMSLLAGITCSVHFVILTVSRHAAFAGLAWVPLLLSFKWPSVACAPDILAWDLFFALSMLCAAPVFSGDRLRASIRMLMIASAVLALAGLSGAAVGDMQLRMIGVVG